MIYRLAEREEEGGPADAEPKPFASMAELSFVAEFAKEMGPGCHVEVPEKNHVAIQSLNVGSEFIHLVVAPMPIIAPSRWHRMGADHVPFRASMLDDRVYRRNLEFPDELYFHTGDWQLRVKPYAKIVFLWILDVVRIAPSKLCQRIDPILVEFFQNDNVRILGFYKLKYACVVGIVASDIDEQHPARRDPRFSTLTEIQGRDECSVDGHDEQGDAGPVVFACPSRRSQLRPVKSPHIGIEARRQYPWATRTC